VEKAARFVAYILDPKLVHLAIRVMQDELDSKRWSMVGPALVEELRVSAHGKGEDSSGERP